MQETGQNDLSLIYRQVSALSSTPELNLSKSDAREALATMWDFATWDEFVDALQRGPASVNGNFPVAPSDLLKTSTSLSGKDKTGYVVRQIGRLINSMTRFPALSERVGVVIPTLYGYTSMSEMADDDSDHNAEEIPIVSNDLIIQSQRTLRNVFSGRRESGITLVSGNADDQPIAFALDAALKLSRGSSIRVVVSQDLAQDLDFQTDNRWKLQNYPSLSGALSSIISRLQHESATTYILSLRGFRDPDTLGRLIDELNDSVSIEFGNRVIIDTGPLAELPANVWASSQHQVVLEGGLDEYNGDTNPLGIKFHDLSQITGFVSRAAADFSFYLLRDRRDGFLITSLEQSAETEQAQVCTA